MSDAGSLRTSPAWDLLAAVVYLGLCLGEVWFFLEAPVSSGTRLAGSVVVTLMAVAVAFRSPRPVTAYFVHGTLIGVATVLGMPGDVYPFGNLFLLATLASVAGPRMAWIGLATAMVGVGSYFWRFGQPPIFAAFTMSLWVLAWAAGRASQGRSRELLLAHDRDLSRAAAQTHEAELALEVQRRDIAREIHDLVGHTINVMVVHAGAGRRGLERDPNEGRDALVTIEEVGRGALDELDGLLCSLSRAPGDRQPVQGLEDVAGLVARVGRAGPAATLDDRVAGPVPAAVGATAYRVVQEALTNTLKHADAALVEVVLSRHDDVLEVVVHDDGRGSDRRSATGPPERAGRGLAGMGERVAALGGALEHGDDPRGGYHVTATIPVRA